MRDNAVDIKDLTLEILRGNSFSESESSEEGEKSTSVGALLSSGGESEIIDNARDSMTSSKNKEEIRAVAKYIANMTVVEWNRRRGNGKWEEFQEKVGEVDHNS